MTWRVYDSKGRLVFVTKDKSLAERVADAVPGSRIEGTREG